MKTKKILIAIAIMLVLILAQTTNAFALQSTSTGSSINDTATNWVINIRKIEAEKGGMGLKETIDTTNARATSESNNIDVHLQKNTEYGAMVLLGASNYGKRATSVTPGDYWMDLGNTSTTGTLTNLTTSTGNISGVYELATDSWEWTAGGGNNFLSNINKRYRDIYTSNTGKPGDATKEGSIDLANWHTSYPSTSWATGGRGFIRGSNDNGVFARNNNSAGIRYYARAAVVCGTGL